MTQDTQKPKPKAVLVGIQLPSVEIQEHESSLKELERLVDTLGFEVIATLSQKRHALHPGTVIGSGKLKELAVWTGGTGEIPVLARKQKKGEESEELDSSSGLVVVEPENEGTHQEKASAKPEESRVEQASTGEGEQEATPEEDEPTEEWASAHEQADMIIFNHELTPTQLRNLEVATDAEVLDRNGVIIEIFHRHAKTKEARLQIEIAQLKYLAPRLRMSRYKGGDRQAGGIGGKGAGESRHELNQRRIRDRIAELQEQLDHIAKEETLRRQRRRQAHSVALVGYTNAGKSSLMRCLTTDPAYVADKLFATLGTTVRVMQPEGIPRILISDTVGFIKDLPHELIASFRSTLEEAQEASLLLHVVDVSDPSFRSQLDVTRSVLAELKTQDIPVQLVLNKKDKLDELSLHDIELEYPEAWFVSAHNPQDTEKLKQWILGFFEKDMAEEDLYIPYSQGQWIGEIHKQAKVLATEYDDGGTHLKIKAPLDVLEKFRKQRLLFSP